MRACSASPSEEKRRPRCRLPDLRARSLPRSAAIATATALTWNMHVCSTLWSGPLADDLDVDAATAPSMSGGVRCTTGASSTTARSIRSRSRAARPQPVALPSAPRAKPVEGGWIVSSKKIFTPRFRAMPIITACSAPKSRKAKGLASQHTLSRAAGEEADGVSVVSDWDPLGMRGTVSRTLLFKDVFVPDDAALMPRGVYFQAAQRWPHMFHNTFLDHRPDLRRPHYDFTVRYLR